MRFDRLFEDLEDQLASEWEAERAALDSEAERLRLSKTTLRERLIALSEGEAVAVDLREGTVQRGVVRAVGADFVALRPEHVTDLPGARGADALVVVQLVRIVAIGIVHVDLLRSARPAASAATRSPLADRMTFGYVLRDAARRRRSARVALVSGAVHSGTIDRVGADHLDLALHDAGAPRRAAEVRGHRLVPFEGIAWVRLEEVAEHDLP